MPSPAHAPILLVAIVTTAVLASGCGASRAASLADSRGCARPDSMFLEAGPVYSACEVDEQATLRSGPHVVGSSSPGSMPRPPRSGSCSRAEIEFVVDERGVPRTDRVRKIRVTSTEVLRRAEESVPTMLYTPAVKDGKPVPQVVRWALASAVVVRRSGSGPPSSADIPRGCR